MFKHQATNCTKLSQAGLMKVLKKNPPKSRFGLKFFIQSPVQKVVQKNLSPGPKKC